MNISAHHTEIIRKSKQNGSFNKTILYFILSFKLIKVKKFGVAEFFTHSLLTDFSYMKFEKVYFVRVQVCVRNSHNIDRTSITATTDNGNVHKSTVLSPINGHFSTAKFYGQTLIKRYMVKIQGVPLTIFQAQVRDLAKHIEPLPKKNTMLIKKIVFSVKQIWY